MKDPENAVDRRAREEARFSSGREGAPRKRMLASAIALRNHAPKRARAHHQLGCESLRSAVRRVQHASIPNCAWAASSSRIKVVCMQKQKFQNIRGVCGSKVKHFTGIRVV